MAAATPTTTAHRQQQIIVDEDEDDDLRSLLSHDSLRNRQQHQKINKPQQNRRDSGSSGSRKRQRQQQSTMRSSSRPSSSPTTPPYTIYGLVLFLGAALLPYLFSVDNTLTSLYETSSLHSLRRSLSTNSLYSIRDTIQYTNLQSPADIDTTIELRAMSSNETDKCSNLFIYMPDAFSEHGHGSQINTYLMAVLTATYLDRPLVLLEPPLSNSKYAGGSQFGCPVDAFHEAMDTQTTFRGESGSGKAGNEPRTGGHLWSWTTKPDFPMGFSRLFDHPNWLSHGCSVPCSNQYSYTDWRRLQHGGIVDGEFRDITCTNDDGTKANVYLTAGSKLRAYYRGHRGILTRNHPSPEAYTWATNLGANPNEAETFSNKVRMVNKVWDYTLGLMNRAGFLKFQPWIARDVELFLKKFGLPFTLEDEYSAIHVRRGDKLVFEARGEIVKYWRSQGHTDLENLPTDYVPFAHYLNKWDGPEVCPTNEKGERQILKHNVYVATDDPVVVRKEIDDLPNHTSRDTVLWNECHELTFHFNPTDASAFHLNGEGEHGFDNPEEKQNDSCFARYHRNIASIADMMLLSKSKTFIGEYNSNWGRVIRTMRVRLNSPIVSIVDDEVDSKYGEAMLVQNILDGSYTKTLDTRIAWGSTKAPTPGL